MITRINTRTTAVALLAAAALAGCGDDGDESAQAPSTPAVAATSVAPTSTSPAPEFETDAAPEGAKSSKKAVAWAEQLCTALVGKSEPIRPPEVAASSPEGTQQSLVTFFTAVVDQQGNQLSTLEDVGPPPGKTAASEWNEATDKLRDVRSDVRKVLSGLEEQEVSTAADVNETIGTLSTELQSLTDYRGPVEALFSSRTVGPALVAEPACSKVS